MSRLRILVVEDDRLISMLLAALLEQLGHDVCGVEDTEAGAVAAAERCEPDLMIVDDRLREGRGLAAVDAVLLTRRVAYVFVTGNIANLRRSRPGVAALEKPYSQSQLVQAIHDATAGPAAPPSERLRSRASR